jgi:hypothetical protein
VSSRHHKQFCVLESHTKESHKRNCYGITLPHPLSSSQSLTPGRSLPLIFCIHMRSGPIYWGGYLPCKKDYRWWYFTCKKPENIICDGILHVNMFHYFKIPYFTCNFFTKFTYNEYIGPYFLSHIVLRFLPSDLPELLTTHMIVFPDTTR